jgi:hypothetical protein
MGWFSLPQEEAVKLDKEGACATKDWHDTAGWVESTYTVSHNRAPYRFVLETCVLVGC